jgi:alanine racemase
VCCADHKEIYDAVKTTSALRNKEVITWGRHSSADLQYDRAVWAKEFLLSHPDEASQENAMHAYALCYALSRFYPKLNIDISKVDACVPRLTPVAMRLDLREGANDCVIVNDAYSADVSSLRIALDFLTTCSSHKHYTAILSDFEQSGKEQWRLYSEIADQLSERGIDQLIGIGKNIAEQRALFKCPSAFFDNAEHFLQEFDVSSLHSQAILIKGSRSWGLERVSQHLERRTHLTTLEVNLNALSDNLNAVRNALRPNVKTLSLVKANAYGTGLVAVSRFLQQQGVDYLGVAFADEGIALRQAGITLPTLVLNPEPGTFDQIIAHRLEPEIYSFTTLRRFNEAVMRAGDFAYPIHIKLDTGMHRLGFLPAETDALLVALGEAAGNLRVASVFSHLAAADEPQHDAFTREQIALFDKWSSRISNSLNYNVLRHIANSAGAVRFPAAQFDMIRLGASLYGLNVHPDKQFRPVCTLKSVIVQIKSIARGETIGYGRRGAATRDTVIGLIPIGYADGLNRLLGNGNHSVIVRDRAVPIIGNICMDMCMLDLTGVPAAEGDEALIFGAPPATTIEAMTAALGTIPYEALARVAGRVKRVYLYE